MQWTIRKIRLELKYTWKISRNESTYKENFIVELRDGSITAAGEVAPNIRYNETPAIIESAFSQFMEAGAEDIRNLDDLQDVFNRLKLPNALRFGIESALVHLLCQQRGEGIHEFLHVPQPHQVCSCYTLPIMDTAQISAFFDEHNLKRFAQIKIKVNEAAAITQINELHGLTSAPLLIDANEAWKDPGELLRFMKELKPFNIAFIEQPMPAHMVEEYVALKPHSPYPLMADESVTDAPDFDLLEQQFHGVNMKLMKAGGYVNGVSILERARRRKMITMVGCMVETTLGIGCAWNLCGMADYADLDGCLIISNEPFHLLKEEQGYFELSGNKLLLPQ